MEESMLASWENTDGPDPWNVVPGECKDDRDMVLSALRCGWLTWSGLDPKWKGDREMTLACIVADPRMVWMEVAPDLQSDHEVVFAAWENGLILDQRAAPYLDREVFRSAVESGWVSTWGMLPASLQTSEAFARSVYRFPPNSHGLVSELFHTLPNLTHERASWVTVIDSSLEGINELVDLYAPTSIRSDRALMRKSCLLSGCVLEYVDPVLQADGNFLGAVLAANPLSLPYMPHYSQQLFPDLVFETLNPFSRLTKDQNLMVRLAWHILPAHWQDRSFVMQWFGSGLPYVGTDDVGNVVHPEEWKDDGDIFLLTAEHCDLELRRLFFADGASPALRGNKDFMLRVIEKDPQLFLCATPDLLHDKDLAVASFSRSSDTVKQYYEEHGHLRRHVIVQSIQEKLELQRMFNYSGRNHGCALALLNQGNETAISYRQLIRGCFCSVDGAGGDGRTLPLLNQGTETSANYKTLIAEYLDVPTGNDLRPLRQALKHLTSGV